MGRYISTGIIYQYGFAKVSFPGIESQNVKSEIIMQLFPEIYDFQEDKDYIYFTLSNKVSVSDLFSAMEFYYSLIGLLPNKSEEFDSVKQLLEGKTIQEAYEIAKENPSYLYQADEVGGRYYSYYAISMVINGKRKLCPVHISVIMIEQSDAKTVTEDDLMSYDLFTDLLRYRMKPLKLADAMLVYLSA